MAIFAALDHRPIVALIAFGLVLTELFALSALFEEAGCPPILAFIPIVNLWTMVRAAKMHPVWFAVAVFAWIGPLSFLRGFIVQRFARMFPRENYFVMGCIMLPFIFYPWMALSPRFQSLQLSEPDEGENEEEDPPSRDG